MRIEQLKFLVAVADCRSITRAAANLFISQPTLSNSMNSLEKELGFAIFHRSQKGVTLTGAGEEVYREAKQILAAVQKWDRFSERGEAPTNDIKIAYSSATTGFLNPISSRVLEHYPGFRLFFHAVPARVMFQALSEEEYQLGLSAIMPAREAAYRSDAVKYGWKMDLLCEDAFHIMISAKNSLSKKEFLEREDLLNIPLAMMPQPHETIAQAYFKLFFPLEYPCYLMDRDSIMELVAENRAAAVFPALSMQNCHFVKNGLVKPMLLREFMLPIRFYLLYPEKRPLSPAEQTLIQIIREMDFQH